MATPWTERTRIYGPPWMIIGISALLMGVVVVMGLLNHNREKKTMGEILKEKGAALIRSFEAGARTGMMGLFGSDARLQTLMVETASQPDIAYIVIAAQDGTILADTDKGTIDKKILPFHLTNHFIQTTNLNGVWLKKQTEEAFLKSTSDFCRSIPVTPGMTNRKPCGVLLAGWIICPLTGFLIRKTGLPLSLAWM